MIEDYLCGGAFQVTKGPVTLYAGLSSGTLTLTDPWPATGSKLSIVASAITSHTDCAGSIIINGAEIITFTQAGRKTSTTSLTALPNIVSGAMDCWLVITVLDSGLAPVMAETLTAINTRIDVKQSGFYNASGAWTKTDNIIYSNSSMNLGDVIRSGTSDYVIKKKDAYTDIGGTVELYTYLA
jgi:hypothetical protein